MSFEQQIQNQLFSQQTEKTFIDKLLSRKDVEEVAKIIKKDRLTRQDLMHLMYMLSGVELKLVNYGAWDRYIMAKYFVWIRDFVALTEQLYDYKDDLAKKAKNNKFEISDRTRAIFENNMRLMEHNVKFLIDLYFNLSRSTLSLGATALLELLKNKYEVVYPEQQIQQPNQKTSPINIRWK